MAVLTRMLEIKSHIAEKQENVYQNYPFFQHPQSHPTKGPNTIHSNTSYNIN